ncbi:MAG TPA: hypothetical protein VIU34_29020, partial [Steroidobacter sp.]
LEWRFSYPERIDELEHAAVRATAAFIRDQRDGFTVRVPAGPMGIAVFAIKSYEVFLDPEIGAKKEVEVARAILDAVRAFDSSAA